jgi:hypothetical protein
VIGGRDSLLVETDVATKDVIPNGNVKAKGAK